MRRLFVLITVLLVASLFAPAAARPPVANWIPIRWHSHDRATLALLENTPINCLLLESADWEPAFLRTLAGKKLVALAVLHAGGARAGRALALGLDLVLEGDFDQADASQIRALAAKSGRLVIELPSRARIRLDSGDPIAGTNQGLWPGLEIEHNGKTVVGPTSSPWINTNGGFLRFLRARTGAAVWLAADPPPGNIFPVERYLQAIGDAAIPGARWILSFDPDFETRLRRRDPAASRDWQRIAAQLNFYEQWRDAANFGTFGVILDRDTGGLLSSFLLDMLAAQRTSARVIPPGRVNPAALQNVSVLLDLEAASLTPQERRAVDDFAHRGGQLLNPPRSASFPEPSALRILPERRDLDRLQALWEMVYNATLRKNFGVRAFNTTGVFTGVVTPDGGRTMIVHLLNFTDFPTETIAVHALGAWKHARLYRPGLPPRDLAVYPVKEGTAVDVDQLATAAAIHFE